MLAILIGAAGLLAPPADDWARIDGFSGDEGHRIIHAVKGPPTELRPGFWRVETADVLESGGETDLAIVYATLEIDCATKAWRIVHEARRSHHNDYLDWEVKDAAFQPVPADTPMETYRAAVCERVRGPLKKFDEFVPDSPDTARYFAAPAKGE